jgi:alpha-1,3-fucosyltransferase
MLVLNEIKIPKSGYINVFDYKTPKDLADYLVYLSRNSTAYNSYFKWRKHIALQPRYLHFSPLCSMCIQLQLESYFGK